MNFNILVTLPLVLLLSIVPAAGGSATGSGDATLAHLAQRYYRAHWQFFPADATDTGIHDYDSQVGSYTPADFARETSRLRTTLADLERIAPQSLSFDGQIDRQILKNSIKHDIFYLRDFPEWRLRPGYYNDIAASGIYVLVARKFAPESQRLRLIIARERQIPALLEEGKRNLDIPHVAPIVAKFALQDTDG